MGLRDDANDGEACPRFHAIRPLFRPRGWAERSSQRCALRGERCDEELGDEFDGFLGGFMQGAVVHADFSFCAEDRVDFADVVEK